MKNASPFEIFIVCVFMLAVALSGFGALAGFVVLVNKATGVMP